MAFSVPRISQADIADFHDAHFSSSALKQFSVDFLPPTAEAHFYQSHDDNPLQYEQHSECYEEWDAYEDDNLGYYPDGVKRTLTDEQIEIFRHSELEALRRAEDKATKLRDESAELFELARRADAENHINNHGNSAGHCVDTSVKFANNMDPSSEAYSGSEAGELEDSSPAPQTTEAEAKRLKKKRARQRKREKNRKFNPEPKVDLRKRTWDVVDAGMDSLDYDELEYGRATDSGLSSKRRQISYDD